MPRPKTLPDQDVLAAALRLMHERGPEALTFAAWPRPAGLSAATLVQRFGSKAGLKQRHLAPCLGPAGREDGGARREGAEDPRRRGRTAGRRCRRTTAASKPMPRACWCSARTFATRCSGRAARPGSDVLSARWTHCFAGVPHAPKGIGLLLASQWQGSLLWWGFDPREPVERYVEKSLKRFVAAISLPRGTATP